MLVLLNKLWRGIKHVTFRHDLVSDDIVALLVFCSILILGDLLLAICLNWLVSLMGFFRC